MKLVQANIWGGRLNNQVLDMLKDESADIVCLQEVVGTKGDALIFTTVEQMQAEANYTHAFFSPVFSFHLMQKMAGFGNAILSRLPFKSEQTIFTRLELKENFDFDSDDYNIRNFQHAVVTVDGTDVHILNHHGHHVHQHKNGDAETMRQCKMIAEYVDTLEGPVILTGDFNLSPHSESLEQINARLTNLSVKYGLKTTRTELTFKKEVCDYIFVSDAVKVKDFRASQKLLSDHQALILEFDI